VATLRSFALLALTLVAGCASESASGETTTDHDAVQAAPPPSFGEKTVNVDRTFSDAVKVTPDSLVVPSSMLGKIEVGSIVAGDRSTKPGSGNPFGFLRRVTEIKTSGKETTLLTEKAQLAEWIEEGRLDFQSSAPVFPDAKSDGTIATKTLKLQGDDAKAAGAGAGTATASGSLENTISIQNVSVKVSASYDGYIDVKHHLGVPTSFKMASQLTLTPEVAAEIVWQIKNHAAFDGSLQGAPVLIPLSTPIPMTVRYTPELKCNISADGEAHMTIGANASITSVVGFNAHGGLTDFPDVANDSQAPTATASLHVIEAAGKATVATECEVVGNIELLAFDAIGFTGRLGPWLNITATACANANAGGVNAGFTVQESHGFTETFNAKIQVPGGHGPEKSQELWSGKQTIGQGYLAGDETTCNLPTVDSCAGKTDGFHCSEVQSFSGIVCQGGQILRGLQCKSTSLKCTSGDTTTITCE
jgi:hypothetical protein